MRAPWRRTRGARRALQPRDSEWCARRRNLGETDYYVYFAPTGPLPERPRSDLHGGPSEPSYLTSVAVFDGSEPDVPLKVATVLDSDFVALMLAEQRAVTQRLVADPRVEWLQRGVDSLLTVVPGANQAFVLDWETAPIAGRCRRSDRSRNRIPTGGDGAWTARPRASSISGASRAPSPVASSRTHSASLSRSRSSTSSRPMASAHSHSMARTLVSIGTPVRAILGRGVVVPVRLDAGRHTFTVRTCADRDRAASICSVVDGTKISPQAATGCIVSLRRSCVRPTTKRWSCWQGQNDDKGGTLDRVPREAESMATRRPTRVWVSAGVAALLTAAGC